MASSPCPIIANDGRNLVCKQQLNLASPYSADQRELGDLETKNVLKMFKLVGKDHLIGRISTKSNEQSWSLLVNFFAFPASDGLFKAKGV